jgi:hypothetical protein
MKIAFQDFSIIWILFCVVLAIAYSALLYYSEHKFPQKIRRVLSVSRAVLVFLIAIFLFSPLITHKQLNFEKPIVLVVQDNSESILLNKNKSYYTSDYLRNRKEFVEKLSSKFDVKDLVIGEDLAENSEINYSDKKSNLSLLFLEMLNAYQNRNLAAVVLASDGIYNSGAEPQSYIRQLKSPVYTLLMGDSTPQKDLRIFNINHNEIVYLKNDFLVELKLKAFDLKNNTTKLSIEHKGKVVWTFNQSIKSSDEQINVQAILNASEPGMQKYTLKASVLPGEKNLKNNVRDFYIDVIENKQQIAIIAAAPHPDLAALKNSIETNENYQVNLFMADNFRLSELNKYQLLILHQLPSSVSNTADLFTAIQQQNIPTWNILGNQTYIDLFNRLPYGLKILNSKANANEVLAVKQGEFQGFVLDANWTELLKELPPLTAVYGTYKPSNALQTLFVQRIGNVISDQALLSFGTDMQRKYAILTAEGLWKWRMHELKLNGNSELFDELTSKIIQYLSSKDDKRKFRVTLPSFKFEQGDKIYLNAELYNDSYELVNTPEVKLILKNEQNKSFDYVFSRTEKAYELELGELASGEYSYTAECSLGNAKYSAKGRFSIVQNNLEQLNTTANFDELRILSKLTGAKAFRDSEYNALADELLKSEQYKTISYEEKKTDEFIHLKWIFFILVLLLSFEWLMRKYHGSY